MSTSRGSEGGGAGGGWDSSGGPPFDDEQPHKRSRKRTKQGVYTSDITLDDLAAHFHQPASKACQELGMGLTIFKRVCRKLGLQRWPYEKPCKGEGERTPAAAWPGGTSPGGNSWHMHPPNHVEAALRQGDRAARSAAINHLAEVLVQDADAAEELLAAISAAVQRQQQGAAAEQQALPHAAVAQQLQPQPPQPMPAPPQAAPQRPTPRLAVMPPQPPQKPPQQQALVEPLPAAWQGMQLPGSQPVSMQQQQQPQLPTNLVGKQLGAGQQPPAQLQQEDLAAVLHVLRAAFEPPSRAAQQPGPSLDLLWQAQQAAQLQKGAVPGGDQLSPLLQQLLKWGQPELQPKQEQQPLGAGPAAALPSVEQPAPQQPQPATHGGAAAPGGSAASPRKTLADTVLAMELLEAAAQQRPSSGQAGAEALLPQPSLVSQQQAVAVPSDDVSLLAAAAQQARGGTAAQEAAAQQVAAMAALPAPVASPQQELAGLGVPPPAP